MDPTAAEFVPSWLPPPAVEAENPEKAEETENAPEQASVPDEPAPSAKAPAPRAEATNEPPDAWDDEDAAPPAAAIAKLSVNGDGAAKPPTAKDSPAAAAVSTPTPATAPAPSASVVKKTSSSRSVEASSAVPDLLDGPTEGADEKKPLSVVLLGHVDAGKSTISGNILFQTGNVDERTMEKFEKEAKALNRESWKFAFALDSSEQERAKGKTEEYGQAAFTTDTRRFTILDAPGHKNYVPHMIGGAAQADIGILVISARKGEFETGFERGGQTREHAMLAKTSGVRLLVVVINKLDDPSVLMPDKSWSEARFKECRKGLEPYLRQVGWNTKEISWIPVSGLGGENLKEPVPDSVCPWFKGPTLLGHLEKIELPERSRSGSVKMPISERHKEMGTMVKGKLESGVIRENDKLVMMPNKVDVVVDAVELEGSTATVAEPGDNVRLRLKGIDEDDIRCGFVLCSPTDLVSYTDLFDVRLIILEHKSIICAGYSAVMHVHQVEVECTIEKLLGEVDKKTGKICVKNPKFVRPGMKCIARMRTSQPVCIEPFVVFPQLGRFMIRDEGKTIAVGTVLKIKESKGSPSAEPV